MLGGCPWRVPEEGRKYYLTLIIAKENLSPSCSWTRDEIKAMPWFFKTMLTLSDCLKLPPKRGITILMVSPPPYSCDCTLDPWQYNHICKYLQQLCFTMILLKMDSSGFIYFFCKTTPLQTMGSFNDCDVHLTTVFTLQPLT